MNKEQLEAKVAYLTQENNQLREALLDARILAGDIKLADTTEEES
ncbi:hypothetical protein VVR12_01845 [Rothia sp. LK2588]